MKTDYESINDETLVPTANSTTYKGIAVLLFGAVTILLATVTVNTFNFNSSSDKFKVINCNDYGNFHTPYSLHSISISIINNKLWLFYCYL